MTARRRLGFEEFSRRLAARSGVSRLLPKRIKRLARHWWGWRWFVGDYATWEEACAKSGGYQAESIAAKVRDATREVVSGRAAFERDGVCFPVYEPEKELTDIFWDISLDVGAPLQVLDFGGALGSTYWRHCGVLPANQSWDVIEQLTFVELGRAEFPEVKFYSSFHEVQVDGYAVLLCSNALQYLEDPYQLLDEFAARGAANLVINGLPLHRDRPDRIRVQRVPPSIYEASYPVRFFNREGFLRRVAENWSVQREFASEAVWFVDGKDYPSTGLWLRRRWSGSSG